MKTHQFVISLVCATSCLFCVRLHAQPVEKTATLQALGDDTVRYLTFDEKTLSVREPGIERKQTFTIVDINGGELTEGDAIKIKHDKFLYETEGGIGYTSKQSPDTNFYIEKADGDIRLQVPSGKYLTARRPDLQVTLTDNAEEAVLFVIIHSSTSTR